MRRIYFIRSGIYALLSLLMVCGSASAKNSVPAAEEALGKAVASSDVDAILEAAKALAEALIAEQNAVRKKAGEKPLTVKEEGKFVQKLFPEKLEKAGMEKASPKKVALFILKKCWRQKELKERIERSDQSIKRLVEELEVAQKTTENKENPSVVRESAEKEKANINDKLKKARKEREKLEASKKGDQKMIEKKKGQLKRALS